MLCLSLTRNVIIKPFSFSSKTTSIHHFRKSHVKTTTFLQFKHTSRMDNNNTSPISETPSVTRIKNAPKYTVNQQISLTPVEKKIFTFLLEVVHKNKSGTTLRAAGGWVRDKILGQQSEDIDIALDNMMGKEFATLVNKHLIDIGEAPHNIGVIAAHPEQSKHLETATMKVYGLPIDFVNLRAEEYADSRIPVMRIGTPQEDAMRRDLTINSLFYNINQNIIEDFTGKGMADLAAGVIRTPLEPRQTFLDDPLRVLRTFRFACRLHFNLDDALVASIFDKEVKDSLLKKVSRERIGKELNGFFKEGSNALFGFKLIHDFGLHEVVFTPPPNIVDHLEPGVSGLCIDTMAQMTRVLRQQSIVKFSDPADSRRMLMFSAMFCPLAKAFYMTPKKKKEPVIKYIVLESVKLNTRDAETFYLVASTTDAMTALVEHFQNTGTVVRKDAGLLLRQTGALWDHVLLLSLATRMPPFTHDMLSDPVPEDYQGLFATYEAFWERIHELGLDGVWNLKSVLPGNEVMTVLGKAQGGPWLSVVMQQVMEWQLENPQLGVENCKEWLLANKDKLLGGAK
mmetsp:Transcript_20492/g.28744  ORF Transcript_20492/g.28744 Transcript_20492/m.28744 type:complete len:568 (-) Transcript_20492:92-1795(-)